MNKKNAASLVAILIALGLAGPADAVVNTNDAITVAVRVRAVDGVFVRLEFDKDLQCGARLSGIERMRAYVYVPGSGTGSAATQSDVDRIQSIATAALLSGKRVTVAVDETSTTGLFANSCRLLDLVLLKN